LERSRGGYLGIIQTGDDGECVQDRSPGAGRVSKKGSGSMLIWRGDNQGEMGFVTHPAPGFWQVISGGSTAG
jgi:hypothetical protein